MNKIVTVFLWVMVAVMNLLACTHDVAPASDAGWTMLRETWLWGIDNQYVPGGAMLVLRGGEVALHEAYGLADLADGRPFTTDAPCQIASLTKPFTATLCVILVDQGVLSWDDPVNKFLPEFTAVEVRGKGLARRAPLLRELLSHTAGFDPNGERGGGGWRHRRDGTLADAVADIAKAGLASQPGERYAYSGLGYMVAGRMLEAATGKEFSALLKELLLEPIGARDTVFAPQAAAEVLERMPTAYDHRNGRLVPSGLNAGGKSSIAFPNPGGGLVSTLTDVARLLMLHRNKGMVGGRQLVSAEALQVMYRKQPGTKRDGYGLGFNLENGPDGPVIRHGGAIGTLGLLDFANDTIVVVFTQVPTKQRPEFGERLERAIRSLPAAKE